MKRIILDTNVYGLLAAENERLSLIEKIKARSKMIVYGFRVIRNELRGTPKSTKIQNKSLRIDLLNLYDSLVEEHTLEFDKNIPKIADSYYKAYREFNGNRAKEDVINDFMIVAAASLNNLDIAISNDEKSMLSGQALRAYSLIGSVINIRTPKFMNYSHFKNMLRGAPNELF